MSSVSASRAFLRRPLLQQLRTCPNAAIRPPLRSQQRYFSRPQCRANAAESLKPPRNPLDAEAISRYNNARRTQFVRKQVILGAAAAITMIMPILIMYAYPIPERSGEPAKPEANAAKNQPRESLVVPRDRMDARVDDNASFQGRPIVVAAGGQKLVAQDPQTHEEVELVPTGTSSVPHFPKTITLPSEGPIGKGSEYTLIGLGIRKVSFLSLQVYVVGLYVKNSSIQALQAALIHRINPNASALVLGEKDELKTALLDPEESYRIWNAVLQDHDSKIDTLFRVVPVRDTNFNHLRDGWVTGITNRIQEDNQRRQKFAREASQSGSAPDARPSEFDDESMALAMRSFKSLFSGRGKAPKASILLLERTTNGSLNVFFQRNPIKGELETIGNVEDERVSRLIWMGYLGGKNVSSEEARKDVVNGVIGIAERPVGSVETQVS